MSVANATSRGRAGAALGCLAIAALLAFAAAPQALHAQEAAIRDLTIAEGAVPVRLVGYGIVTGLDGTGDRTLGGRNAGHTVQSVANLLRRFDIEVPAEVLRLRNVAAVLVTAELSPYLRAGNRFEVHVSSLGDARSLRGGVLWMTPLVAEAGEASVATAQGALLVSESGDRMRTRTVTTTARIPSGGILEAPLPRIASGDGTTRLLLREPDIGTAMRIASAVDAEFGASVATVEDPGAVALDLSNAEGGPAVAMARVQEIRVALNRAPRVIVDGRDGTVVAGGDVTVDAGVVSHGEITLTIGDAAADTTGMTGSVNVPRGTSVQQVASALHAVFATPSEIAVILTSLRDAGALNAEVIVR